MYKLVAEDTPNNSIKNMGTADEICSSLKAEEKRILKEHVKGSKIDFYIDCGGEWFYNIHRPETSKEKDARLKKAKFMSEIARVSAATRRKHVLIEKKKLYDQLKKELGYE